MKQISSNEITALADDADAAAKKLYESLRKLIDAAKHERSRRIRSGIEHSGADYVIATLSARRDSIERANMGSELNALGCGTIISRMLQEGWEQ